MTYSNFPYRRVVVVGTTGSGKSTLAEKLARQTNLVFIDLDALKWLPDWVSREDDDFRALVEQATEAPGWVIAGNYRVVRDITWQKAEAIIWLDYPVHINLWRLFFRTVRRSLTHELLWGTNYENFWKQLKLWSPQESIFRWFWDSYAYRKREFPRLFKQAEHAHLKVIQLTDPRHTDNWLKEVVP